MAQQSSDDPAEGVRIWCDKIAVLAVDALVDSDLIVTTDATRAVALVSDEIFIRLSLFDYPPVLK